MHISDAGITFIITNKLKTTKRVLKPKLVKCIIPPNQPWMSVPMLKVMFETCKFRKENHDDVFFVLGNNKTSD